MKMKKKIFLSLSVILIILITLSITVYMKKEKTEEEIPEEKFVFSASVNVNESAVSFEKDESGNEIEVEKEKEYLVYTYTEDCEDCEKMVEQINKYAEEVDGALPVFAYEFQDQNNGVSLMHFISSGYVYTGTPTVGYFHDGNLYLNQFGDFEASDLPVKGDYKKLEKIAPNLSKEIFEHEVKNGKLIHNHDHGHDEAETDNESNHEEVEHVEVEENISNK